MTSDEMGMQLHEKATRGRPLSGEEQALLTAWYAQQDEAEGRQLAAAPSRLATLREEVNSTLTQIITVSQYIQTMNQENESLRKEIAVLEQRLIQQAS